MKVGKANNMKKFSFSKEQAAVLAMANMVANGQKFAVVQKPDWCGGHFVTISNINCGLQDFEYILWEGTPSEYAAQMPTFSEHYEPLHGKPEDTEVGAKELLKWYLNS